jgi:DNA-binding transcriptional MerR regulator
MTTTTADRMCSIGEVSERTGLSRHTLRFYEKEGLFIGLVQRNAAGRRVFSEQEIGWLNVCSKLRSTGMPLPDIRRYVELVRAGSGTVEERFLVLREHEARVRMQLADLQDVLSTIEAKVAYYARRLAEGTADQLWLNGPECTAIGEDGQRTVTTTASVIASQKWSIPGPHTR